MESVTLPTTGVRFTNEQIQSILTSLTPPLELASYEATSLGYNNKVYFLQTKCGKQLVLKAGGRHWTRRKTEAEVAGSLLASKILHGVIRIPRIIGFSSAKGDLPWEWVLQERVPGHSLQTIWQSLSQVQKTVIAEQLAVTVASMRAFLGSELPNGSDVQIGNLSLTAPEEDLISPGQDHLSFSLESEVQGKVFISNLLDGKPPSTSYLDYVKNVLGGEISELSKPELGSAFANELQTQRLPRLQSFLNHLHEHPGLRKLNESPAWRPVLTHGDFQPQNILVSLEADGLKQESDKGIALYLLDWEWSGFFPPHLEWDAGLDNLTSFLNGGDEEPLSETCRVFKQTLQDRGILSPWSATAEDWKCAMNMTKLCEHVVPWWLSGYPPDGGEGDVRKIAEEKRTRAAQDLDKLLSYFGY